MESINPVDKLVGMPRNATKAQDSQPERREDSKYAVEKTMFYSNFADLRGRLDLLAHSS